MPFLNLSLQRNKKYRVFLILWLSLFGLVPPWQSLSLYLSEFKKQRTNLILFSGKQPRNYQSEKAELFIDGGDLKIQVGMNEHVPEQQRPVTQSHWAEASWYHGFQALQNLPPGHWSEVLRQFTWTFICEHAMEPFGFINPCKSGGGSYFVCTSAKHIHYHIRFLSAYSFPACLCVEWKESTQQLIFSTVPVTPSHMLQSHIQMSH